ncbi:MAG: ABC transporter permease subunit [Candidatus Pacebacteria bacterium]|nr:ABC transporter permease subunit [Candidatus Paceibacterota bacterium]
MSDHSANTKNRHMQHSHHHMRISYPKSWFQRLYSIILVPLSILVGVLALYVYVIGFPGRPISAADVNTALLALSFTFIRLFIAYILALIVSMPLSILITKNKIVERIFLPLFDIIQSIPVLAFFPVIILVFVHSHFLNGAAIFIFFLSMVWNLVFSVVGGLRVIPNDIKQAAQVFHIKGWQNARQITLPSIVPYIVTGSLLAWAQGWNIIIVGEVLHTYIQGGTTDQDLFGIGSILVHTSASGQQEIFLLAIVVMIIFIGLLNLVVWQRLLQYSEKFKFE